MLFCQEIAVLGGYFSMKKSLLEIVSQHLILFLAIAIIERNLYKIWDMDR